MLCEKLKVHITTRYITINPLSAKDHFNHLLFVLLADQITVSGNEMSV